MSGSIEVGIEQHPGKLIRVILTPRVWAPLEGMCVNVMTPFDKGRLYAARGLDVLDTSVPPPGHGELGPVSFAAREWRHAYPDRTVFVDVHVDPLGDAPFPLVVEVEAWSPTAGESVSGSGRVDVQA